jgi:hypothetical protein
MFKKLKYMNLSWSPQDRELRIFGDNKWVNGEIYIKGIYLYSIFVFITRIFRKKNVKHTSS